MSFIGNHEQLISGVQVTPEFSSRDQLLAAIAAVGPFRRPRWLRLDYEGRSECEFGNSTTTRGLWNYSLDPTTEVTLAAYQLQGDPTVYQEEVENNKLSPRLESLLRDPDIIIWAFNAAFERVITKNVLKIDVPYSRWRCTMVLAYMRAFSGGLGDIGGQLQLGEAFKKNPRGEKLIQIFSKPQKVTKNQPHRWRDKNTDPELWQEFKDYNKQDVVAEGAICDALMPEDVLPVEWELYAIDQEINDTGIPFDRQFVERAHEFFLRRKHDLNQELNDLTGLNNANSRDQLLPWLRERGYRFQDLGKLTVQKELKENKEAEEHGEEWLTPLAETVLEKRLQANRTSPTKFKAILRIGCDDNTLKHTFQFCGASRTGRDAGRSFNFQNLTGSIDLFDVENKRKSDSPTAATDIIKMLVNAIRDNDYEGFSLCCVEPMSVLAALVRAAFQPPNGKKFIVRDLSSIESAVIGWLTGCERLLKVFRDKLDPYKDFATELYGVLYDAVTKDQRKKSKPAVLGCGYGLGIGDIIASGPDAGKKSGLWGYAENMKIDITKEEATRGVNLFRSMYHEIKTAWGDLDKIVAKVMADGVTRTYRGLCRFSKEADYLTIRLPSGRKLYYFKPKMLSKVLTDKDGKPRRDRNGEVIRKLGFTYMGKVQNGKAWVRLKSWGGKLIENIVQAIARDVLFHMGVRRAWQAGFNIVGRVHDELIALVRADTKFHTGDFLGDLMTKNPPKYLRDCPLGSAGYETEVAYYKD